SARVNIGRMTFQQLTALLSTNLDQARIGQIAASLGLSVNPGGGRPGGGGPGGGGPGGGPGGAAGATAVTLRSPLDFYVRSRMTFDEFSTIGTDLTVAS